MPQLLFQVRLITSVGSALFVSIYVINFIRFVKDADQGVGFSNCAHFLRQHIVDHRSCVFRTCQDFDTFAPYLD